MPMKAYDLTGRTALVTGAASGIGRASAVLLAQAGATVVCADRDGPGVRETAELIEKAGGAARARQLDVTDRAQIAETVAETVRDHGRLDILAAIAGIMHSSSVLETDDADLDRVLGVNFKGVLHSAQEAARVMTAQRSGSIITMASGAIDTGARGLLCYSVSKAAVVQLTKTLAAELGPLGIRANAIAPGFIRTPMTSHYGTGSDGSFDETTQARAEASLVRMAPLGRVGTPEDVAGSVLFLASDASAFTTGQILRPNGGVAMPW
ncbi:SDR family NAD(P)-dependent oxidoreductase [Streptomyces sp. RKAG337]|uniref:SDR family NAD(P)-dependent oxidoreductase n=1 Tax=Streptomyces sp. RKAG337 TaxID=2893404 RepID=UPI002033AEF3|nr:SDR family NAD(P)-dependent oxidoreductase [Streptomyces sp. RKAG337]MCM2425766.1 SDR family oxidoreductase [Streptomyces sp. RKAG337]